MELDKKDAVIVDNAIKFWESSSKISTELANDLRNSYQVRNSNVDAVAIYSLISAISCGLLAFGALVIDEKWIELLRKKWGFSETIVGIGFTLLVVLFVVLARRRKIKYPDAQASNETYNITIILTVGIAITYWTRSFSNFEGNYALPLLIAAITYGAIAIFLHSKLLWVVMLISLAGWWGAQTHFWSGGNFRFAGMNYPLRMTAFGLIIWGSSWIVEKVKALDYFTSPTYNIGLFFFLLAAWTLSIFGNYDDLNAWTTIKQGHFWYWAVGFTIVLGGLIAYAFQTKNDALRDMGLIFFLLNIYTRYFEYFWDRTNKGIFFAILAFSFWFVGRKAEQWRSKEKQRA
ncbi:hypothetical protein [Dyadobacter sp. NIV53]|uniref:hypothetical protein n=1 Tax=Dyadobacter sp. NIV53 TaxID=2861765 RepID=UPI001C873BAC|nr:hypothetical protein [Dyadobacter sp. NIV53]